MPAGPEHRGHDRQRRDLPWSVTLPRGTARCARGRSAVHPSARQLLPCRRGDGSTHTSSGWTAREVERANLAARRDPPDGARGSEAARRRRRGHRALSRRSLRRACAPARTAPPGSALTSRRTAAISSGSPPTTSSTSAARCRCTSGRCSPQRQSLVRHADDQNRPPEDFLIRHGRGAAPTPPRSHAHPSARPPNGTVVRLGAAAWQRRHRAQGNTDGARASTGAARCRAHCRCSSATCGRPHRVSGVWRVNPTTTASGPGPRPRALPEHAMMQDVVDQMHAAARVRQHRHPQQHRNQSALRLRQPAGSAVPASRHAVLAHRRVLQAPTRRAVGGIRAAMSGRDRGVRQAGQLRAARRTPRPSSRPRCIWTTSQIIRCPSTTLTCTTRSARQGACGGAIHLRRR